jgi:general secretion pathway protein H
VVPGPLHAAGFTLIELLVTLFVMALLTGVAALALPHGRDDAMQREAQRLAALFDAARTLAADGAMPVVWAPGVAGYDFLRPSPRGWAALGTAPLTARGWAWSDAVPPPPDYVPLPRREATVSADGVRVSVEGGSAASNVHPGWLVFGTEPVSPPIRVTLRDADHEITIASDGIAPFALSSQR